MKGIKSNYMEKDSEKNEILFKSKLCKELLMRFKLSPDKYEWEDAFTSILRNTQNGMDMYQAYQIAFDTVFDCEVSHQLFLSAYHNVKGFTEITKDLNKKNKFIVTWTAAGYCGEFRYSIVAVDLESAKDLWDAYVKVNSKVQYSWKKAVSACKYHHGGYISWKNAGSTDQEVGCYEMDFLFFKESSDHLRD